MLNANYVEVPHVKKKSISLVYLKFPKVNIIAQWDSDRHTERYQYYRGCPVSLSSHSSIYCITTVLRFAT